MKHNKNVGISANVETFINLNAKKLIRTRAFLPGELDDIKQELWLYYYEKLFPERSKTTDNFLFISIKGEAKHILRSRLKQIQAGLFFTDALNGMQDDDLISDFASAEKSSVIEDQIFMNEIQRGLKDKEKQAMDLFFKGFSEDEIAKMLHVSDNILLRIGEKIKQRLKK